MRPPAARPRPRDVGDDDAVEDVARACAYGFGRPGPLGGVDDQPVDDVEHAVELAPPERRQVAPAQEDGQVGQEQRLDDAPGDLGPLAAEADADRLGADLAAAARRVAGDRDVGLDAARRRAGRGKSTIVRDGMPLGEPGEHVLGRLDPLLGHPRDVRRDARALVRAPATPGRRAGSRARARSARTLVRCSCAGRHQCRRHSRPSRRSRSSEDFGPQVPAS